MADPLVPSAEESKLTALNKKIIEIKKKIQLSEGQRKANFEECDAKKRDRCEKIANLKKEVKVLQIKFAKAKNNEDAAERIAQTNRATSACVRKRGLEAAIAEADEDNIRLRKKLDLVKYQSDKQQDRLTNLLQEYEELVNGRLKKIAAKKLEHPLKKKIVILENQLHRVGVMQMEADTVRKKYRCVRSSLKADASFYVSSLRNLEESIRQQDAEINQLQGVKEEAIELRDITRETLTKQEIEAMNTSKTRDLVILDYRQRVEDRKLELERLERIIFPATRQLPRDDFEGGSRSKTPENEELVERPKDEVARLEEAFAKLRAATGVTRTEDVLDRFLGQRATKEKLQKMRLVTEDEKISLERTRQQLTAEIESQKFSETKDADENAEALDQLNRRIADEMQRQKMAETKYQRIQETLNFINRLLWKFCDKLKDVSERKVPEDPACIHNSDLLLDLLAEKMTKCIELLGGADKFAEIMNEAMIDQVESLISTGSKSDSGKAVRPDDGSLFPRFPGVTTPGVAGQPSEDEEEVPTRTVLKRQAQLLVDTKNRRKGFVRR